jgi:hypothetical protein
VVPKQERNGRYGFSRNGEIAMSEGKNRKACRYFEAAEQELWTLESENTDE